MKRLLILGLAAALMPFSIAWADLYIIANKDLPAAQLGKSDILPDYLLENCCRILICALCGFVST